MSSLVKALPRREGRISSLTIDALEFGLYPFVVGDALKLVLAAAALPLSRRWLPAAET